MWHLLTHTSGLTYGFHHAHPVDEMYRAAGFEWGTPAGRRPRRAAARSGRELPLVFQPGTEWNYGVSTDVLGRVIEVLSGQPLDEFFARAHLRPAGHERHRFCAPEADHGRLAALYGPTPRPAAPSRSPTRSAAARSRSPLPLRRRRPGLDRRRLPPLHAACCSAAASSTAGACSARARVRYMTDNHLPGDADLEAVRPAAVRRDDVRRRRLRARLLESSIDPVAAKRPCVARRLRLGRRGEHRVLGRPGRGHHRAFFTQLLPSSTHPIRSQLRQLVHQALID